MAIRKAETMNNAPKPKCVEIDMTKTESIPLIKGPPESITMRSGLVVLQPGESVGKHNTGVYEEIVVALEGEGEMLFGDGGTMRLSTNIVAYCPPHTEHDVRNCSGTVMRYIYIVARSA
jgi:mannose-6-phosphate isomerase-like protein (cupin superfamily)